ncbi:arsinothricin resistance N-acetyltransferase ArsN1 [soil metagenome]
MRPPISVREGRQGDAPDVAAIYNEGIRERNATFETRERSPSEVIPWLTSERYPMLVAYIGDEILGWIAASQYRPRECYTGIAEFSVYVARRARGLGIGDTLMRDFLPALQLAGFWKVLSRIFPENAASRALCARHGFREVGLYTNHARLDGRWRDVLIVERLLSAAADQ